jgi:hypothetical protein
MTAYDDVPEVNALYAEQAQINQALDILDNWDGTVRSYTVIRTVPDAPPMGVTITTVDPGQSLLSGVRSSLIQRNNAINKALRDLGVTNVPPDHAGGPHPGVQPV